MFTGIIEATAAVTMCGDGRLTIERPAAFSDVRIGSSISVSGACLTIVELTDRTLSFDAISETLSRTTLGGLRPGDWVNLERAMLANGRFDGHVLQGHVEGVAPVTAVKGGSAQTEITIELPRALRSFAVEKGSIAIDGVSLTIAQLQGSQCTVAIIPHTLRETTLGKLTIGGRANIETDILGRYAVSFLSRS